MAARLEPQPMCTFDPTSKVIVHEQVHDVEVEWVPVTAQVWADKAKWHDADRTVIAWGEMLLDCWWATEIGNSGLA